MLQRAVRASATSRLQRAVAEAVRAEQEAARRAAAHARARVRFAAEMDHFDPLSPGAGQKAEKARRYAEGLQERAEKAEAEVLERMTLVADAMGAEESIDAAPSVAQSEECPLCFEPMTRATCKISACCGKKTCKDCVDEAMKHNKGGTCPYCRADMDPPNLFKLLRARAERGDARAQSDLGDVY